MSEMIGVCGPSGSGKTRAIQGLDPKVTMLISLTGKKIPMKGFAKLYNKVNETASEGNFYSTTDHNAITRMLKHVDENRPDIKNIVLDDYQYNGAFEYFQRASESGFAKFAEIAQHIATPLIEASKLRDDLKIFVTNHDETITEDYKPLRKFKTIGKLVDNSLTMEGLFTIVLFTNIEVDKAGNRTYTFVTNSDGSTTAKSPEDMFPDTIPNDLGIVAKAIDNYYEG